MGKKHGFRGTPVRPSNRLSSVGGIFERRGDPMVSPREGREKFGRNLESENPDLDQYFATRRVDILKPEQIERGEGFRKSVAKSSEPDTNRKIAQAMHEMHREMRKQVVHVSETNKTVNRKINCPMQDCSFLGTDKQVSHHLRLPKGAMGACKKKG